MIITLEIIGLIVFIVGCIAMIVGGSTCYRHDWGFLLLGLGVFLFIVGEVFALVGKWLV